MAEQLYLGKHKNAKHYLQKHSWDCDWYWDMGCVKGQGFRTPFAIVFFTNADWTDLSKQLTDTKLTQEDWLWLLERMKTAYALREAAAVVGRGGAHVSSPCMSPDPEMATVLNDRLGDLLNEVWEYLEAVCGE